MSSRNDQRKDAEERKLADRLARRQGNLAPEPERDETIVQFVYRTFENWHEKALPRAKQHYFAVIADRVINPLEYGAQALHDVVKAVERGVSTLERGVSALERIADGLKPPAPAPSSNG